jgi:hypothetical protein
MESAAMKTKTTIVTTTINIPHFLTGYVKNARRYSRDTNFIVVGDTKSDPGTAKFCDGIANCEYLDVASQISYMSRYQETTDLLCHLPYESVERRNIGILKAYEDDADIIVTIDDDNFATNYDAVGSHQIVGTSPKLQTYHSEIGWFNVCTLLEEQYDVDFYHRGYSPRNKWKCGLLTKKNETNKVVVNAGLWTDNPDVDAITRLERKLTVIGFDYYAPKTIALAPSTWSPFNCQNTALAREVIPSYFMSPNIGRHADIFASYVVARLAGHFGDVITFGAPLSAHHRSPHDLWHDLDIEREGMQRTDDFCDQLRAIKLTAKTYHEGFQQIIDGLKNFDKITEGMKIWHDVFERIL